MDFMKNIFLCCLLACIGLNSSAQSLLHRAGNDEIAYMSREEPAMKKAFQQAAATLDEFLALAKNPKLGTSNYSLKVAISDAKNTEYFWVNSFSNVDNAFSGRLGNEPRLVKKVKFDEKISFDRTQIADWTYINQAESKMMGNFTACALLTKESKEQAASFKKKYGLMCD